MEKEMEQLLSKFQAIKDIKSKKKKKKSLLTFYYVHIWETISFISIRPLNCRSFLKTKYLVECVTGTAANRVASKTQSQWNSEVYPLLEGQQWEEEGAGFSLFFFFFSHSLAPFPVSLFCDKEQNLQNGEYCAE